MVVGRYDYNCASVSCLKTSSRLINQLFLNALFPSVIILDINDGPYWTSM